MGRTYTVDGVPAPRDLGAGLQPAIKGATVVRAEPAGWAYRIGTDSVVIVKTAGDSLLVEFPSVVEAVACAVVMQQWMAERNKGIAANQGGHFLRAGIFKEACYSADG